MARAETIARLHAAPVKSKDFLNSPPDIVAPPAAPRTIYRRFRIARESVETYTVAGSDVMGMMPPGAPVDRTRDFAIMAQREQAARLLQRLAPEMRGKF
jgi:hypothetical protein